LSFEEALSKIQNHHVDLAIEAATAIEDNVLDVVPQKSCADLNVVVEGIVRNIKEKYRTLKTDYEEATNFGRHNGLTLL
jgi:predicted secreted Zn-dependent protease